MSICHTLELREARNENIRVFAAPFLAVYPRNAMSSQVSLRPLPQWQLVPFASPLQVLKAAAALRLVRAAIGQAVGCHCVMASLASQPAFVVGNAGVRARGSRAHAAAPAPAPPAAPVATAPVVRSRPGPAAGLCLLALASSRGRRAFRRSRLTRPATAASDADRVPVDRERYTDAAWQAMQDAPQLAQRMESQYVEPEHVFLACLEQPISTTGGLAARILEKVGIQKQTASDKIMEPWQFKSAVMSLALGSLPALLTANANES